MRVDRRELIRFGAGALTALAGALFLEGCGAVERRGAAARAPSRAQASVWSWFDLPAADARSRELSALAWSPASQSFWSVQDDRPLIVELIPDRRLRSFRFGETVTVAADGPLDLEGLVVTNDGFVVCSERGPRILELDRRGALRREVDVPARFRAARENKSLEALSISPGGKSLFTTSEAALAPDGALATTAEGTRVRILRLGRDGRERSEHLYTTDPSRAGGSCGISDIHAVSERELLVLERGFTHGFGNDVRIYRVNLEDPASETLGIAALPPRHPSLEKALLADIAGLEAPGIAPSKQAQPNPVLDNYEGMTSGPVLPDGRASLVLVSDDNARPDQVARVLVLALA